MQKLKASLNSGKYVLAVSGGVDSVVLLDLLSQNPNLDLVVAHYDHGIRPDSVKDEKFVQALANKYNLEFFSEQGKLGQDASEALAREKRYEFLRHIREQTNASVIITAHHQDDLLETAILNLLRGTGRKGLSSLKSTPDIKRPLLNYSKAEILKYAKTHELEWHEDSTNSDERYLRNYIRRNILPKFDTGSKKKLLSLINSASLTNAALDNLLAMQLKSQPSVNELNRVWFSSLPHDVSREVAAAWLRANSITDFDRKTIERISISSKTLSVGKQIDAGKNFTVQIKTKVLRLTRKPNGQNSAQPV